MNFYASEADELRRFREREPLVQAAIEAHRHWVSCSDEDTECARIAERQAMDALCIASASTDAPAAADLAHGEPIGATESLKKASDEP